MLQKDVGESPRIGYLKMLEQLAAHIRGESGHNKMITP